MNKVIAADGQAITIPGDHHHFQVRAGQLKAGGKSQRPAVGYMQGVGIDISGSPPRAADTGHQSQVIHGDFQLVHRPEQRAQGDTVATTWTHEVREKVGTQVIAYLEFALLSVTHG